MNIDPNIKLKVFLLDVETQTLRLYFRENNTVRFSGVYITTLKQFLPGMSTNDLQMRIILSGQYFRESRFFFCD